MLADYFHIALRHAQYEILPDDGTFYGEIPGFQGVYANAETLEACRDLLAEVLEEWTRLRIARHLPLPIVDGVVPTIPAPV
ncbi:MAG: type II toxin-antitoxin system HicB family antitoxin [Thermomicrobiales bacterium]